MKHEGDVVIGMNGGVHCRDTLMTAGVAYVVLVSSHLLRRAIESEEKDEVFGTHRATSARRDVPQTHLQRNPLGGVALHAVIGVDVNVVLVAAAARTRWLAREAEIP